MSTLFEKIIAGEIPANRVYEDEYCIAIRDIQPQAPVHVLIIPRKPLLNITAMTPADETLIGHLFLVAHKLGKELLPKEEYRLVINNGDDAGQTVPHLHIHLLGGRKFLWPAG